jgi:tetratricopeptide (TPR) repeat protein
MLIEHHDYEAVALFCDRAQALVPSFALTPETAPAVGAICHRLDGHPLAIVLAAVQMRRYTPQELLLQLDDRLGLLVGGPVDLPQRHQALVATIAWSYELLEEDEQQLFAQLAVFVGGWTSEAAETVCRLPDTATITVERGLDILAEKSLLTRDTAADGTTRFAMLDTLREFALRRLGEREDAELLRQRHAAYALAMAEAAEAALGGAQQGQWLTQLDHDHDNVRAALQWLLAHRAEQGLRLAAALRPFWSRRGYVPEGQRWLAEALAQRTSATIPTRAKVLNAAGVIAWEQGHYKTAQQYLEESLLLRRALADGAALVDTLCNLAIVLQDQDQNDAAYALYSESLVLIRQAHLINVLSYVLNDLGALEYNRGNYTLAHQHSTEALTLATAHEDSEGIAIALDNLGMTARARDDYREAEQLFHRALQLQRDLRSPYGVAHTLTNLGVVCILRGDYVPARGHLHEALRLYWALDNQRGVIECLEALANVAAKTSDDLQAVRLWGTASTLRTQLDMEHTVADAQRYGAMINELRHRLDPVQFAGELRKGSALSLKDTVATLLAQTDAGMEI